MPHPVAQLYQSPNTVLTSRDLALLWRETDPRKLNAKAAYYVRQGILIRLIRGVFARSGEYDPRELPASLYSPAYLSFETALRDAGIIFQHYETLYAASRLSTTMRVDQTEIKFRKLKDELLYNPAGIQSKGAYSIAGPERAFLDTIYLFPRYYFDNLTAIDWEKCKDLALMYNNRQMIKRLDKYRIAHVG